MTRGPWPLVVLLAATLVGQLVVFAALPQSRGGQAVLVPIRPPLTRPDPTEALLIAGDSTFPPSPEDRNVRELGERADVLRVALADDARRIGSVLRFDQLLYIFSQRDRLVRDRYEGRWYAELVERLENRANP